MSKIKKEEIEEIKKKIFRNITEYRKSFCDYPDFWLKKKPLPVKAKERLIDNFDFKSKLIFSHFNQIPEKEILLYFHFPFCSSMCLFCNVLNLLPPKRTQMNKYIDYLKKELDLYLKHSNLKEKTVKALYFGGGTPAEMPQEKLLSFINYLRKNLKFDKNLDFTIETHPKIIVSSGGQKLLNSLKKAGVNRISLGIQSFNDLILKINHRTHSSIEAIKAVKILKKLGFLLNIDMMFGLPGQSHQDVQYDLKILEKLKPDAIEYFRLEHVNPKISSLFELNQSLFASEKELWKTNFLVYQWLLKNNYEQNGTLGEKNQTYRYRFFCLKGAPYLGFGRGVASHFKLLRSINTIGLGEYYSQLNQGKLPIKIYHFLTKKEQMTRDFYFFLQLRQGINKNRFQKKYNLSINRAFGPFIKSLKKINLLEENKENIRLSDLGTFFVSDICFSLIKYVEKK